MLAPALMDICGNYDLWDFVNVHTTCPLCGWTRSELAMRVTRPVRGRVVRRRPDAGGPWALHKLRRARGEPHNSRVPQPRRGCIPTWGDRNGAVVVSLDSVLRRQLE